VSTVIPQHVHRLDAAGGLMGQGVPQSLELGQEIAHGLPRNQLSDGFAASGDHHRLAGLRWRRPL
jgi:hypothetical protein